MFFHNFLKFRSIPQQAFTKTFFHTTSANYESAQVLKSCLKPFQRNTKIALNDEEIAFANNAGISHFDSNVIIQILTHKSYKEGFASNNERLLFLGNAYLEYYSTCVRSKKIDMEKESLNTSAKKLLLDYRLLAMVGLRLGMHHLVRYADEDTEKSATASAMVSAGQKSEYRKAMTGRCVVALIGALYHVDGPNSARAFIETFLEPELGMFENPK